MTGKRHARSAVRVRCVLRSSARARAARVRCRWATPGTYPSRVVRGYFPMQRMTDPYVVYVKTIGKSSQNGGLEMTVLADAITSSNASDITSSEHVGAV